MIKDRIGYARKLLKFKKTVEAGDVIDKLLNDGNTASDIYCEALIIKIFDIALKKEPRIIQWNIITPWIEIAAKMEHFPQHKLDEYYAFEQQHRGQYHPKKIEFSESFHQYIIFFKTDFINLKFKSYMVEGVIVDFQVAQQIAWNQDIELPYQNWNSLRSQTLSQLNSVYYKQNIILDDFEKVLSEVWQIIDRQFYAQNVYYSYFYDDLIADIELILKAKFIDYDDVLIDQMLKCYQSGYLPCGWVGD